MYCRGKSSGSYMNMPNLIFYMEIQIKTIAHVISHEQLKNTVNLKVSHFCENVVQKELSYKFEENVN